MSDSIDIFDKPTKYGSWTVAQLREELGKRGAKKDGRKADLIDRLDSYDRNQDFGKYATAQDVYEMKVPDPTLYKDLHTDLTFPEISMETTIDGYLHPLNKTLGKESIHLVNERFLPFIRICEKDGIYFIKSQCRAEMKKAVTYNIDISLDEHAVVCECQCDCGAGMGPEAHCKHVNAVLYALFLFSTKGRIVTERTCTQKLQSFHRVKIHKGSPVKATNLTLPSRTNARTSFQFDPRPVRFRQNPTYEDHFRNTCLQYPNIGIMPISQLFKPANMYAVSLDHDYLQVPTAERFLEVMQVTKIDTDKVASIEQSTRGQSSNKLWLMERSLRLTSSVFGKICKGKDSNKQKLSLSLLTSSKLSCAPVNHGRKYEGVAIKAYERLSGTSVKKCGIFISEQKPFIASSPDGLIGDTEVIEVKCPYAARDRDITVLSVPYLYLDCDNNLRLRENHDYYYQVQGQLFCTKRHGCHFIVYTFKDVKHIYIKRDDAFIADMVSSLTLFFNDHFKTCLLEKMYYKQYGKYF